MGAQRYIGGRTVGRCITEFEPTAYLYCCTAAAVVAVLVAVRDTTGVVYFLGIFKGESLVYRGRRTLVYVKTGT